ncbi:hypothetical protein D3C79_777680 [compost metagenome]
MRVTTPYSSAGTCKGLRSSLNCPLANCAATIERGSMAIIGADCSNCRNMGMEMVSTQSAGVAIPATRNACSRRLRMGVPTGYSTHGQSPSASSGVLSSWLSGCSLFTTRLKGSGSSGWKSNS